MQSILFVVLQAAWILAIQFVLGRILTAFVFAFVLLAAPRDRSRWTRWLGATRTLQRSLYPALGVAIAVAVLFHLIPLPRIPVLEPYAFGFPGLATLFSAAATVGAWLAIRSGRLEAAGRIRPARRLIRPAGFLIAGGASALAIGWFLKILHGPVLSTSAASVALVGWGIAANLGLLAALSGKPRPGGTGAAIAHVSGVIAAIAAIWP